METKYIQVSGRYWPARLSVSRRCGALRSRLMCVKRQTTTTTTTTTTHTHTHAHTHTHTYTHTHTHTHTSLTRSGDHGGGGEAPPSGYTEWTGLRLGVGQGVARERRHGVARTPEKKKGGAFTVKYITCGANGCDIWKLKIYISFDLARYIVMREAAPHDLARGKRRGVRAGPNLNPI